MTSDRGATPATVRVSSGDLVGTAEAEVVRFLGVPYAAAPVGELRFALPAPPKRWRDPRDASRWGATAPQSDNGLTPQDPG